MAAAIPTEPENKADECFGKKCFNCIISYITEYIEFRSKYQSESKRHFI